VQLVGLFGDMLVQVSAALHLFCHSSRTLA
jgi:hypothetical protein